MNIDTCLVLGTLTPNGSPQNTWWGICAEMNADNSIMPDSAIFKINGKEYFLRILPSDNETTGAKEGDILVGQVVSEEYVKAAAVKEIIDEWAKDICYRYKCSYKSEIKILGGVEPEQEEINSAEYPQREKVKTPHEILGVSSNATDEEIKRAYKKKALANHPDRAAGLDEEIRKLAEKRMKEINAAYEKLKKGF